MAIALLLHRADGSPIATEFRKAAMGPSDPFGAVREIAWSGDGGMTAGRIAFRGAVDVASYPHLETISIVEGELTLREVGAAPLTLKPRQAVVIGQGTQLRLEAAGAASFVYCSVAGSTTAVAGLTVLDAQGDFKPSAPPPVEIVLGPMPECRSANVFTDASTRYRAGAWDSTPYARIVRPHRVNELMHLLEGDGRFEAPDGSALTAVAGDVLFVPKGAAIGWESTSRVAKFYVIQELAD